ncbi:prenyltransferase/squalene oxidase repeat-containing protein [Auraticoccus monumenti]|uniref:Prenyltransferase and squalene oxidase repeat-containing protein n=1 Tax=Auraticoccus monumenti TaxID=675864 RepID=A0A1G6XD61_9ACTN|nr:hypothetical protein [Auraticoccus monumenti]SDD76174.1 hypothetical protein SAMN04489747_1680 [Auraticoccus monumenti]
MSPTLRSLAVGSTAGALLLLSPLTTPAHAAPAPERAVAATSWLAGQTEDGLVPGFAPGYPDTGLTIDALLALVAAGAPDEDVRALATGVEGVAADFIGYSWEDGGQTTTVVLGGSVAKVLLLTQVLATDPTDYAGEDVLALTRESLGDDGLVRDTTDGVGDRVGNVFAQSLAVTGLARADELPVEGVEGLLEQQCADGWFRLYPSEGLSCEESGDSAPDPDATAMAVMALLAADAAEVGEVDGAVDDAVAWLLDQQRADGSFGGGVGTEAPNANSTGLVAAALHSAGETGAAGLAGDWVADLQLDDQDAVDPADVGAVAYDPGAFDAARVDGIGTAGDQWRRATAQAVLALAPVGLHTLAWTPSAEPTPDATDPGTTAPTPGPSTTPDPGSSPTPDPGSSPTPDPGSSPTPGPAPSTTPDPVPGPDVSPAPSTPAAPSATETPRAGSGPGQGGPAPTPTTRPTTSPAPATATPEPAPAVGDGGAAPALADSGGPSVLLLAVGSLAAVGGGGLLLRRRGRR